ncbi:MAG: hypothetical protein KF899_14630 [Parvibaculum sp.]|nr:hypothetical protein [Parvibaculum sp.]
MTNTLGWRRVYGIATPSVNTVVQPEYDDLRPAGVVNHTEGMHIPNDPVRTPEDGIELIRRIDEALENAVDRLATCRPDHIVLGISAESIWGGGLEPARRIEARIRARAGDLPVTQAADALPAALAALGISRRIGVVHPYAGIGEGHLVGFFEEVGYDVVRTEAVRVTTPAEIAHTAPQEIVRAVREVDGDDIEAIVQFGANLPAGRIAAAAEIWLGKPVIAVNVATYWYALRRDGISDKVEGYGSLFSRH